MMAKKVVCRIAACLCGLVICGCSSDSKGGSGSSDDKGSVKAEEREKSAALVLFNRWIESVSEPWGGGSSKRELTPEEAMGLERPGELAASVYTWAKTTEMGDYYRQSREFLASIYKKLIDDYKVRKESDMGSTAYTDELMRNWRTAYRIDYDLRKFILECYSRKELLPMPPALAKVFTAAKEAEERLRRKVKDAKDEIARLKTELAALKGQQASLGEVSWSRKQGVKGWNAMQAGMEAVVTKIDRAAVRADALARDFAAVVRENKDDAVVRGIAGEAEELQNAISSLARRVRGELAVVGAQVALAKGAEDFTTLESELASIKAAADSVPAFTWTDEKDVREWRRLNALLSEIASRAEQANARASELARNVRPAIRAGKGDAGVAAFGVKVERLCASLSEIAVRATERATIAEAQPQRITCMEKCASLEKELAALESAAGSAAAVSWTDERQVDEWEKLLAPTTEFDVQASKASAEASALVKSVKPVVRISKGDKSVAALDARIERLAASLSAVSAQASDRLAVVKGQVPLTKFANDCKTIADGMTKVPSAFARKKARVAEIGSLDSLVRSSRTRNYSDLDELARKVADVKARSLAERKEEIALGQRAQKLIAVRESVMGSSALYRLRMRVPGQPAKDRVESVLAAFRRMVGAASKESLPGVFTKIESMAFQLSDCTGEDALLNGLEETLRVVQRLAARQR